MFLPPHSSEEQSQQRGTMWVKPLSHHTKRAKSMDPPMVAIRRSGPVHGARAPMNSASPLLRGSGC
ncbi:hypothetical protein CVS28_11725 [Arthrobacter glacialis]|nr:hypothetical protein CVS28_11725 [Arthrobacter glacialis]